MRRKRAMVFRGEQITPIDGKVAALWRAFGHEFSQLSKDIVYYGMTVKPYSDGLNQRTHNQIFPYTVRKELH